MPSRIRPLALAAAVLVAACAREEGTPDAAYRAFAGAAADRDADRVWSMLSSQSRSRLEERARAAAGQAPDAIITADAKQLVIGNAEQGARPVGSVVVLRESRDRAVLRVSVEGGGTREVTLVREGGWRIELPGNGATP